MNENRTPNYGLDPPLVVRNMLIVDVRHTSKYAATLRDAGLTDARCVQGVFSYLLTLMTFGSVRWGYVIGSRAAIGGQDDNDAADPRQKIEEPLRKEVSPLRSQWMTTRTRPSGGCSTTPSFGQ